MSWANCGKDSRGRNIGYAWPGKCGHRGCKAKIDHGLAYACGGMHGNLGEVGCEGYFCNSHLRFIDKNVVLDADLGDLSEGKLCPKCYASAVKTIGERVLSGDLILADGQP